MSKKPPHTIAPPARPVQATLVKDLSRRVRKALADALTRLNPPGETDQAALMVERAASPVAPARLANAHPGDSETKAQACALYERCLTHYREVVRAHESGLSHDDVGAAVACFVAANMQALHGVKATPAMLLQLERQLSGVTLRSAVWDEASARERQNYFEQMAILSVLIGASSAQAVHQGPAAVANVRRAARGYLQQLLGLNADELRLGASGLTLGDANDERDAPQAAEPQAA